MALQTFLSALYNLAAHPEYLEPLREEVDSVVHQNGWTKTAIDEMHMIDSFLKESHRFGGSNTCEFFCSQGFLLIAISGHAAESNA